MDRIETMKAFVMVAEEGGFTKAADKLGLSNQLVSKYVSHFEAHLNVRLLIALLEVYTSPKKVSNVSNM